MATQSLPTMATQAPPSVGGLMSVLGEEEELGGLTYGEGILDVVGQ